MENMPAQISPCKGVEGTGGVEWVKREKLVKVGGMGGSGVGRSDPERGRICCDDACQILTHFLGLLCLHVTTQICESN